jgi:hypothetical protein
LHVRIVSGPPFSYQLCDFLSEIGFYPLYQRAVGSECRRARAYRTPRIRSWPHALSAGDAPLAGLCAAAAAPVVGERQQSCRHLVVGQLGGPSVSGGNGSVERTVQVVEQGVLRRAAGGTELALRAPDLRPRWQPWERHWPGCPATASASPLRQSARGRGLAPNRRLRADANRRPIGGAAGRWGMPLSEPR